MKSNGKRLGEYVPLNIIQIPLAALLLCLDFLPTHRMQKPRTENRASSSGFFQ